MHDLADRIAINPNICSGKPWGKGTRIPEDTAIRTIASLGSIKLKGGHGV
ncbi:MAG: hypothetical protein AB1393_13330 [Candidatus Edwardsbacteria bacterium]